FRVPGRGRSGAFAGADREYARAGVVPALLVLLGTVLVEAVLSERGAEGQVRRGLGLVAVPDQVDAPGAAARGRARHAATDVLQCGRRQRLLARAQHQQALVAGEAAQVEHAVFLAAEPLEPGHAPQRPAAAGIDRREAPLVGQALG